MLDGQADAVGDLVAGRDGLAELGQIGRQIVRVQRPRVARRDGDELLRVGLDIAVHAVVILIGQHAGEDRERAAGQIILDVLDERLDALRVVPAVDDKERIAPPHVEPAGPADTGQTLADVVVGQLPAALLHDGGGRQGDGRVVQLVVAEQRQLQTLEALPVEDLTGQVVGKKMDVGEVRLVELRADRLAAIFDDGLDGGLLTVDDGVAAGLDDAGLRRGDLLQRVAQHLGMVEADVADDGGLRRQDDVRRVKFAAHADLAHDQIAALAGEIFKAQRRDHLKLRRLLEDRVGQGLDVLRDAADLLVGDLHAIDLDALVEPDEEGAGVQARLVSGLCEHAGQHRAGRTLAVRAGHVDEFQLPLGVAHFVQKRADALETGDTALPADGMDIIQRFVKRHDGSLLYVSDFFSYLTGGQSLAAVNTLDLYSSHTTAASITNVTPSWIDRDASFVRKNAVFASPP